MKNLILIALTLFCFKIKAQPGDTPPNAQSGKCYAKCSMDSTNQILQWQEVLCGDKIHARVVQDIAKALQNKGYKVDVFAEVMNYDLKIALRKYQQENKLPMGNLNIKTLDALEISY